MYIYMYNKHTMCVKETNRYTILCLSKETNKHTMFVKRDHLVYRTMFCKRDQQAYYVHSRP